MTTVLIVLAVAIVGIMWWLNRSSSATSMVIKKVVDVNRDGRVNLKDVAATVRTVVDVNRDGKVNIQDATATVQKVANATKKVVKKIKSKKSK
jgi:hypothetical protein